mmetsp:Transcript_3615/g.4022  ORF Transcript_3615/g.4022 Transcript_3615/m.4022 type:complete len:270 (-) Transcript_3615:29-838(-)
MMNRLSTGLLKGLVSVPLSIPSTMMSVGGTMSHIRSMHQTMPTMEKYYKITKYAKPVDDTKYQAGDSAEGVKIPLFRKQYPNYHYETMFFKRQNRGLYGGLQRKRSKTCSESKNKNLRAHKPNIVKAKLWSETLNKTIATRVSTTVLRTITREGGLDNYLLKDKPARVKTMGLKGWNLKYDIMKKREFNKLPKVEKDGNVQQVYYVHRDGMQVTVGKNKLLEELWEFASKDTWTPITWKQFLLNHTYLTTEEIVDKLHHYNFDFSKVSA